MGANEDLAGLMYLEKIREYRNKKVKKQIIMNEEIKEMKKYEIVNDYLQLSKMIITKSDDDGNPKSIYFRVPIFRGVGIKNAIKRDGHYTWTNSLDRAMKYANDCKFPHLLIAYIEIPKNSFTVKYYNQMIGLSNDFTDYDFRDRPYLKPSIVIDLTK